MAFEMASEMASLQLELLSTFDVNNVLWLKED